jgi:hypothetical protein
MRRLKLEYNPAFNSLFADSELRLKRITHQRVRADN